MMKRRKVLILDVAADSGGAEVILRMYHERALQDSGTDYVFCVSVLSLAPADNVQVLRFPWVKKSWFHRLFFDHFTFRRLARREAPDEIWSLQNTLPAGLSVPTMLYLHQPLPFIEHRFTFRESRLFWVYQHLIARTIYASARRADRVVVQTQWMKDAVLQKTGIDEGRLKLEPPPVTLTIRRPFSAGAFAGAFFYPASAMAYKNHRTLLEAARLLLQQGTTAFTIGFTLRREQLPWFDQYPDLNDHVLFLGPLPHDEVLDRFGYSALVFPSYVETYGLPLLEARTAGAPVIASDCAFSHELLSGYEDAAFFPPLDAEELCRKMKQTLERLAPL